jgi:hypothetical protein
MSTAVAQIPTDTASATAQMTNHIMLNPPIDTDRGEILDPMVSKICHDLAEMSPVQKISATYPNT